MHVAEAPEELKRVLTDLIISEVSRTRNLGIDECNWPTSEGEHHFDDRGLALDSLEFLELAANVSERFGLYESPIGDRLLAGRTLNAWVGLVDRYREPNRIHFRSSGSTGEPSTATHRYDHLYEEAEYFASLIRPQRVLSLVPAHHIYGYIWTTLLPSVAQAPLVSGNAARSIVHQSLEAGDMIVASPPWWDYVSRTRLPLPPGVTGINSTGPLNAHHARTLREMGLSLFEVYGASETAGVGYRTASGPYQLLPWWRFLDERRLKRGDAAPIELPDRLRRNGNRRFELLGRRDQAVQVGGHNVSPAEVRAKLVACPAVIDAHVRLMRPDEGTRLKAIVVVQPCVEATEKVRDWVTARLSPYERPRLTFSDALPISELGKARDW